MSAVVIVIGAMGAAIGAAAALAAACGRCGDNAKLNDPAFRKLLEHHTQLAAASAGA